ncbi:polyprenyl synthetase family protein [Thermocaproicibacter melissae]|uniref:polyprenyl synthetase family protein n=1 Tax=Thermocaproicibacter melissae TaxID=2966552 RepID=UPI0024B173C4|nr:farnesyl diphosphate synthase [Thermocaproicibacter melissae]WBY64816.1 polyprenyl synthetase family protein [Thermocaproicibacter melissae]
MGRIDRADYISAVEEALARYVPETTLMQSELFRAMRYSLLAGGKRIRPILVLEFCGLCGGDQEAALPFACAVEMIHTYSLIHDDLPCMDNDDMRRGKPSNHVVFGEAQALLAGDALLTRAFEVMLSSESIRLVGAEKAANAAGALAFAAGAYGMAGGQAIDLMSEGKQISIETLQKMDECKTGALIRAAAKMGCILAGAESNLIRAADEYAAAVGFAFQIVDDILDVKGNAETLGKPIGSDKEKEKSTYVSLLGMEKAQKAVSQLTEDAVRTLDAFNGDTSYLRTLAMELARRDR